MTIQLTPEDEELIQERLRSGVMPLTWGFVIADTGRAACPTFFSRYVTLFVLVAGLISSLMMMYMLMSFN
jgi:hypothetical protein